MKHETVTLGEREFVLKELPLRRARQFRESLKNEFGVFVTLLENAPQTDITSTTAISGLLRTASTVVFDSVDKAAELLYQYDASIAAQREFIEDNATSSEVVDAFLALIGLSFPFFGTGRGQRLMNTIQAIGSNGKPTLTN